MTLYPTPAHRAAARALADPACPVRSDDVFVRAKAEAARRFQRWQPAPLPLPYRCEACAHRFDTPRRYPAKMTSCPRCASLAAAVALHSAPVVWVGPGEEPK